MMIEYMKEINITYIGTIATILFAALYIGIAIMYKAGIIGMLVDNMKRKWQLHQKEQKKSQKRILGYSVITRDKAYDGCKMYDPEGVLIAQISHKRYKWYLKKELAEEMEPGKIKLKFKPGGKGNAGDPFYLSERKSVCVVCGSGRNYIKYHIVPYIYRKALPEKYRTHNSYDVVLMCPACHKAYSKAVHEKQKEIAKEYKAPLNGRNPPKVDQEKKHIKSTFYLLKKLSEKNNLKKIPAHRIHDLWTKLQTYGKAEGWEMDNDLKTFISSDKAEAYIQEIQITKEQEDPFQSHGTLVVKQLFANATLETYTHFVQAWRRHFIQHTKPKYMNDHWRVDHHV